MAAINFPSSPTIGQEFTANGIDYEWTGSFWVVAGDDGGGPAGGDLAGAYPDPTIRSSVALTGVPTAPTSTDPSPGTSQIATTGYVHAVLPTSLPPNGIAGGTGGDLTGSYPDPVIKANVNLTGAPTAVTAAPATSTTQLATTQFVTLAVTAGGGGGGSGTVTSTSVVSANGLAGTVATPTTTPAITLSTTVTGMLKGNGTAISAATAGTDYLTDAPSDTNTYGRKDAAWIEIVDISSGTYQNYLFNAGTVAPPASGSVRFNNPTQTLVTTIYFSYTTNDSNAVNLKTYWAQRVKAGDHFYFQDKDDPLKWKLFRMDAAYTDSGTYATMAVTYLAGGNDLTAGRIIVTREGGTDTSALQPLDADLTALAALTTTGMMARSAANTYTMRTITGTASRLSVTNGDGVSGNPTLNIDTAYVGQNTITTLGTVTTGTWNGTVITGQYGGTGVANTGSTVTLGGNFATSGAFGCTLTVTGTTNVTLPTTGTLATTVDVATIAQNAQTGNYTAVLADAGKHLYHAVAAATATYTIPANGSVAYPIGTTLTMVNDSANAVTISITTDTLVLSPGTTTGSRTLATGGVATALKVTSTRWIINGTGLT